MAATRKRPSYQARRNELARAAGWRNYSEQRAAAERGYRTAAEFRIARKGERALPAARPLREMKSLPAVATSTAVRGYYTTDRDDQIGMRSMGKVIKRAAGQKGKRVAVWNGDRQVGRKSWNAAYLWSIIEDGYDGDFALWLDDDYGDGSEASEATGGVSVRVS